MPASGADNGHIYLTALAAVEALATAASDPSTAASAAKALALGQQKLSQPISSGGALWDSEKKFWHAHSETPTQIFTDTLYGQMLAHHHLQNFTLPVGMLKEHLNYEWERNQDKYGMRVLRDPIQEDSICERPPPLPTVCCVCACLLAAFLRHVHCDHVIHCECAIMHHA